MTLKELYAQHKKDEPVKVEKAVRPVKVRAVVPVSQVTLTPAVGTLVLPGTVIQRGYITTDVDDSVVTIIAENVKDKSTSTIKTEKKNGLTQFDVGFINKLAPCIVSIESDCKCHVALQLSIGEVDVTVTDDKSPSITS